MPNQPWSGERVSLLRRLWAEGATAADIGERLGGLSRSAVLGKVFRLRLGNAPGAGLPPPRQQADPQDDGREDSRDIVPARRRRRQPRKPPPPPRPSAVAQHRALLELTNRTCRWPHGRPGTARFFFCGALGADLERGVPYCPLHMRRAYRPEVQIERATRHGNGSASQPKELA